MITSWPMAHISDTSTRMASSVSSVSWQRETISAFTKMSKCSLRGWRRWLKGRRGFFFSPLRCPQGSRKQWGSVYSQPQSKSRQGISLQILGQAGLYTHTHLKTTAQCSCIRLMSRWKEQKRWALNLNYAPSNLSIPEIPIRLESVILPVTQLGHFIM